jgi:glycosyltransferase involved in cell wall biosynthesis
MLWSRFPGLYFATERHITRFVDQVYTVSTRTLAGLQHRYGSDRAKFGFVPTWVDREVFAAAPMPKRLLRAALVQENGIHLNPDAPWVLYAGRLQPQKAPERLIEAFAALRQAHPEARLLVAGDGNLRAAVENRIRRLRLEGAVQLLGAVPQAELVRYYQASDAYVLVSDYEGMPMGMLEALACALPVVTTDVGEVRRVVVPGVTGELCGSSPLEIARALACVLESPQRYARARCVEAVAPYSAERVLAPLYARIRLLARGSLAEHER